MSVWATVAAVGAGTIGLKAVGPVLLGGRPLPPRIAGVVELLAPALLSALVLTQAVGGNRELVFDARLLGLGAAAIAFAAPRASPARRRRRCRGSPRSRRLERDR